MRLTIIASANGSGKTTFALSYAEFSGLEFINTVGMIFQELT